MCVDLAGKILGDKSKLVESKSDYCAFLYVEKENGAIIKKCRKCKDFVPVVDSQTLLLMLCPIKMS